MHLPWFDDDLAERRALLVKSGFGVQNRWYPRHELLRAAVGPYGRYTECSPGSNGATSSTTTALHLKPPPRPLFERSVTCT